MKINPPRQRSIWKPIFVLILIACIAGIGILFFYTPEPPPPFEVANFMGNPETFSRLDKKWVPIQRGEVFGVNDKIRTSSGAEVDLKVLGNILLRVKENSQIEGRKPWIFEEFRTFRIHLRKGAMLGAAKRNLEEDIKLKVSTLVNIGVARGTLFRVEYSPESKKTSVGVLQGNLNVSRKWPFGEKAVEVKNLQIAIADKGKTPAEPTKISRDEWRKMKEAYELIQKSAALEAKQLDLSKKAGSLFAFVFDHGTFYIPKVGFAEREFVIDETTGEVVLNVRYDVFPRGSYVGMYMLARNLDFSKFGTFTFEARQIPGEDYPVMSRIEIKSKGQMVQKLSPKVFKKEWRRFEFPIKVTDSTLVSEITLVFHHSHVGEYKKGGLQFRNIGLGSVKEAPQVAVETPQINNEDF